MLSFVFVENIIHHFIYIRVHFVSVVARHCLFDGGFGCFVGFVIDDIEQDAFNVVVKRSVFSGCIALETFQKVGS